MAEKRATTDAVERWEDEGGAMAGRAFDTWSEAGRSRRPTDGERRNAGEQQERRRPGGQLPSERVDWFTKPLARFFQIEAAAAILLAIATLAALTLANSGWSEPVAAFWNTELGASFGNVEFSRSLRHWINDGLLTLFFFVVALELKRELVLGELRNVRTAVLSFAGALGGIVMPAGVYLLFMSGKPGVEGWGTVTATSAAFVVGCLALLGTRIPLTLRLFLLSLAIFDDIGAILIVGFGYGGTLNWTAVLAAGLGVAILGGTARLGIRNIPVYFAIGTAIWLCVDASGIHPTLTGVVLGMMTPTRRWVTNERLRAILGRVISDPHAEHASGDTSERKHLRQAATAARESSSPIERLESVLHPWVAFAILPLFACANAGVTFSKVDVNQPLFMAICVSFVLGKPAGVIGATWIASRLGLAERPPGLTWPLIAGGSLLTGIGFIMALFIAGLAYAPAEFDAAKAAILLSSLVSASAGIAALFWLTSKKRAL